jgi:hypothetical protein
MLTQTTRHPAIILKEFIGYAAGGLGFIVPAFFAWDIYTGLTKDPNTATWLMVWFMDVTGLIIVVAEGNRKPWLQVGWLLAATLIILAIFFRGGNWYWGNIETISTALCVIAFVLWQACNKLQVTKNYGVWVGLALQSLAIFISFIPQGVNYLDHPRPETWYVWFFSIIASLMAIYAAEDRRNPAHVFIPWSCAALNAIIFVLVLR